MRIESSNVNMASERTYSSYLSQRHESILTTQEKAATLEFSDESKTLMEQMEEHQKKIREEQNNNKKNNLNNGLKQLLTQRQDDINIGVPEGKSVEEIQLEILRQILYAMKGIKKIGVEGMRRELKDINKDFKSTMRGIIQGNNANGTGAIAASSVGVGNNINANVGGTVWTQTRVTSSFYMEREHTAYQANGLVKTADGREINFGVTLEMSRSFCQKYEELVQSSYIMTDPLVINLDTNIGSVTDQKFLFDLDSDGDEEEVSFAGQGSGFLALDKNGDGKINNGNELFGTKSGDGFKDLAAYDVDGNGWIDEADDVFKHLKVWTKDAEGNDRLIDLKQANVGAIYLGHTDTQFSLNELETNKTNGVVRSTGIYLKESGEAGTIQHIDLAI